MAGGYHHLTYGSRCQIYALKKSGLSIRGVARALEVSASTMSRELHRYSGRRGYRMKQAQRFSESRRRFASSRPHKLTEALWGRIEGKLCLQWSPQQIAGRLRHQGGASIGKTWIYRQVWKDRSNGVTLYRNLRRRCKKAYRRGRCGAGRGVIPGRVDIVERPAVVESKRRVGDWELDTILGARHRRAKVSMVDRCSKFTFLRGVESKTYVCGWGRGSGVFEAGIGAGAHVDGGQRQGVFRPPGGGGRLVGGVLLCHALSLLGAWPERAHQRLGAAVFSQGDGLHRRRRSSGPAGAGPSQRPSPAGVGLPHAGGSVWRGPGSCRRHRRRLQRSGAGGARPAGRVVAGVTGLPILSAAFAGGGRVCCARVAARRLRQAAAAA